MAGRDAPPRRALSQHNRCDEAIAATRNIGQVATARLAVAERPSHGGDMDLEVALLDVDAGPDARGQLVLGDQVAGALDQGGQDLERAAAKLGRVGPPPAAAAGPEAAERARTRTSASAEAAACSVTLNPRLTRINLTERSTVARPLSMPLTGAFRVLQRAIRHARFRGFPVPASRRHWGRAKMAEATGTGEPFLRVA